MRQSMNLFACYVLQKGKHQCDVCTGTLRSRTLKKSGMSYDAPWKIDFLQGRFLVNIFFVKVFIDIIFL